MRKNKKVIFMAFFLMVLIPLFAGCDDPYAIKFINYMQKEGSFVDSPLEEDYVYFEVSFGEAWEEGDFYFNVTGPGDISVGVKGMGVPTISPLGRGVCYSISEYSKMSRKEFPITVNINNIKKYVDAFNNSFNYQLTIYEDNVCSKAVTTRSTRNFSFSIIGDPDFETAVVENIGGESQYCNVDSNGNYIRLNTDNLFVAVAYSQEKYFYKKTDKDLNVCSGGNGGNGSTIKYSKYGNTSDYSKASLEFVNWVAKKCSVSNTWGTDVDKMISWANNNGRWYTDVDKMHEGDLRIDESWQNKDKIVKIVFKNNYDMWDAIGVFHDGNMAGPGRGWWIRSDSEYFEGEELEDRNNNALGFINMKGISY